MIDINLLKQDPQTFEKGIRSKGIDLDITKVLDTEKNYRELFTKVQLLREERNISARLRDIEKGKEIKIKLEEKENEFESVKKLLDELLNNIPNLPKPDVKTGRDESENEIVRKSGEIKQYSFIPHDHVEIGERLDIIDIERASKISGTRFYFLKNEGVLLEFALKQFAFDTLVKEGFIPILPPVLIKEEIMRCLGYMENGGDEDMYILDKDKLILVGTSEQSIVPMHKDEVLNAQDLPKRYVSFSTCFRREAGSYGKDTKGILRAHQFDKVEMVSYVAQGDDDREHDYLLLLEEKLLQSLNIPYQVVKMCTGDLGYPVARKYDIEGWIPSQNKYRELTSTSTTGDFQARALNIKYRDKDKNGYVNILNGTAFSTRPIIAILENNQQEDGSVLIPEVLRKYTGFEKITPKNK